MFYALKLKENPIGRSAVANTLIYGMIQPMFSIYLRILLNTDSSDQETLQEFYAQENFIKNMTSCAYIIGYSLEHGVCSTLEMAMIMLESLIKHQPEGEKSKNIEQVPSHAFNKLPIMACQNVYEQIITLLIYGLIQLKKV